MDLNRLTQKSQQAVQEAQTKALRYGHVEIDGEHLLLALLEQQDGLLPRLLARMEGLPQVQIIAPDWMTLDRYALTAQVSDEYRLRLRRRSRSLTMAIPSRRPLLGGGSSATSWRSWKRR